LVADVTITTMMSSVLYDLIHGDRLWNQYARNAMEAELIKHHERRIPRHFAMGAHDVYGYAQRSLTTKIKKKKYWKVPPNLDLVRSNRSKTSIVQRRDITFGGRFGGPGNMGTLQGRLNMYLPYPLRRGKRPGAISPEEIEAEIVRTTDAEAQEIGEGYVARLANQINAFAGPMRFLRKTSAREAGRPGGGASQFNKRGSFVNS
jgi:hypothetical protein